MAKNENGEKVVSVSTERESGGITATVITNQGNVYTGRSHWFNTPLGLGEATKEEAIREATNKINR